MENTFNVHIRKTYTKLTITIQMKLQPSLIKHVQTTHISTKHAGRDTSTLSQMEMAFFVGITYAVQAGTQTTHTPATFLKYTNLKGTITVMESTIVLTPN